MLASAAIFLFFDGHKTRMIITYSSTNVARVYKLLTATCVMDMGVVVVTRRQLLCDIKSHHNQKTVLISD